MLKFRATATSKADTVSMAPMASQMQILVRLTVAQTTASATLVVVGSLALPRRFIRAPRRVIAKRQHASGVAIEVFVHPRLREMEHDDVFHGFGYEVQGQAGDPIVFDCTGIGYDDARSHVVNTARRKHRAVRPFVFSGRD